MLHECRCKAYRNFVRSLIQNPSGTISSVNRYKISGDGRKGVLDSGDVRVGELHVFYLDDGLQLDLALIAQS